MNKPKFDIASGIEICMYTYGADDRYGAGYAAMIPYGVEVYVNWKTQNPDMFWYSDDTEKWISKYIYNEFGHKEFKEGQRKHISHIAWVLCDCD